MPQKKIRVHELAKELGLTNKECLDLCIALGIGVKTHSSSIEDPQADRVRRKADADGLRRDVQPEEPEPVKKTAAKKAAAKKAAATLDAPAEPGATEPAPAPLPEAEPIVPAAAATTAPPPAPPAPPAEVPRVTTGRVVTSRPASEVTAPRQYEPAPAPPRPAAPRPAGPGGLDAPTRPRPAAPPAPPVAPPIAPAAVAPAAAAAAAPAAPTAPAETPIAPAASAAPSAPTGPAAPPTSASGKPIPPPPGPPRSASGKPIPPPPGARRPAGGPGGPGGPGGSRGPGGPGGPGSRPGGAPGRPMGARTGGGGPGGGGGGAGGGYRGGGGGGGQGQGFGAGFGTRGGPAAGPGNRGGGGPNRGRTPGRRRRRRRDMEELGPTAITAYMPSNAPVPEGEIIIERGSSAQEVGPKLNRTAGDVVRFLFQQGEMVTATQSLSDDAIELFAVEVNATINLVDPGLEREAELAAKYFGDEEDEPEEDLRPRPPIITVMGHVDHGKTLLLDRIREANVVAGEAGGITQHIGAYQVNKDGRLITFIDTPGHEAFTAMRARGAEVTDIVILMVAADDGVMPQTIEAIDHARAAEVPIVVALNKIDRENADPNRVMQQLSEYGLMPEAWGGDTIIVEISALQNLGIDDLLEQLLLVADVQLADELVANPEGLVRGVVLEANLDTGRGPVATVIVENGTLRVGDTLVAGAAWGRVRALVDDKGDNVKEALPSMPVQVLGLNDVPAAGDEFRVADDKAAKALAEHREQRHRFAGLASTAAATGGGAKLEDIFEQIQRGETATLNVILKADVHGSLEAVSASLQKLERDEVKLGFVRRAVGGITESDIQLAATSGATIIGFNVRPDRKARELADNLGVEIRLYEIIYKLLEDLEAAMVGMLKPEYEEVVTGEADVRAVFSTPRGKVAGCYVQTGVITRNSKVRYLREGVVIWKGSLPSLRRIKDDVREVAAGFECGIMLSDFNDVKEGDVIETYEEREVARV